MKLKVGDILETKTNFFSSGGMTYKVTKIDERYMNGYTIVSSSGTRISGYTLSSLRSSFKLASRNKMNW